MNKQHMIELADFIESEAHPFNMQTERIDNPSGCCVLGQAGVLWPDTKGSCCYVNRDKLANKLGVTTTELFEMSFRFGGERVTRAANAKYLQK